MRIDAETLLQIRGQAVHEAKADDGMALEFVGEGFEEDGPLQAMDRRGGGLDGGVFVAERLSGMGERLRAEGAPRWRREGAPRWRREGCNFKRAGAPIGTRPPPRRSTSLSGVTRVLASPRWRRQCHRRKLARVAGPLQSRRTSFH